MAPNLDEIRILVCIPFLLYSCYSDFKTRRVPNKIWMPLFSVGAILALLDFYTHGTDFLMRFALSVTLLSTLAYPLFKINAFGGADAKAIIALSILVPTFPSFGLLGYDLPLTGIPPLNLFAFSAFGNAVLLTLVVPVSLFIYNLTRLSPEELAEKPPYLFIGYKSEISKLKNRHIRLIQDFIEQNGNVIPKFRFSGVRVDDALIERLQRLSKDGKIPEKVWVMPGMPFMISLSVGFAITMVYGDLVYLITAHMLGM
ncbi:MAG: A24 family peptidase C-terminal domain-containing protein [Methanocellales archaeon]|nr:A24 family peptidase C-terminal domain-containing protein [Methanocellales archaeon]